jgi:hypothetical protein
VWLHPHEWAVWDGASNTLRVCTVEKAPEDSISMHLIQSEII